MPTPSTSESTFIPLVHPPCPRLAFRVGVVGHRPNRLPAADLALLRERFRRILQAVVEEVQAFGTAQRALFDGQAPLLRALSPLAEGTDRLFAEAALDLGFALCCPMPFTQEEYEKDFAAGQALEPDSLARFRGLLDRAEKGAGLTRFELDGQRKHEADAYGHCGSVLVRQSDLLLVVWDGERLGKPGGTEQTLDEARRAGVPVVWIDAKAPHDWRIFNDSKSVPGANPDSRLSEIVRDGLELYRPSLDAPVSAEGGHKLIQSKDAVTLEDFLAERKPAIRLAVVWQCFRDLFGDSCGFRLQFGVPEFEQDVLGEWPADRASAMARIIDRLRPFYAWPDKLANRYADAYRSVFLLTYLLAALAVGLALMPIAAGLHSSPHHSAEAVFIMAELVTILVILTLVFFGKRRRWHERWIHYRLLAELVRHVRLVAPVGGGRPFPQLPAHLALYGHPHATWVAWYVRAIEREVGLPAVRVDQSYLSQSLGHLLEVLRGQKQYHERNARRCHRIETLLHRSGLAMLGLTLLACALHLLPFLTHAVDYPAFFPPLLTFACGFLPALGAAMAGINNQGEFLRIAKRSNSMALHLTELIEASEQVHGQIRDGTTKEQPSTMVQRMTAKSAQLMVNEVLDWRVVFVDRPLNPPA